MAVPASALATWEQGCMGGVVRMRCSLLTLARLGNTNACPLTRIRGIGTYEHSSAWPTPTSAQGPSASLHLAPAVVHENPLYNICMPTSPGPCPQGVSLPPRSPAG